MSEWELPSSRYLLAAHLKGYSMKKLPLSVWVLGVIAVVLAVSWLSSFLVIIARIALFLVIVAIIFEIVRHLIRGALKTKT